MCNVVIAGMSTVIRLHDIQEQSLVPSESLTN